MRDWMSITENIQNTTKPCVVITNQAHKVHILSKLQAKRIMKPIQFLTPRDLFDKVFFKLKPQAMYTLSKVLNKKPAIIAAWLEFIPFLSNKHANIDALTPLFDLRDVLHDHDLIEPNPFKTLQFNNKALFVYGTFKQPYMTPLLDMLAREHKVVQIPFAKNNEPKAELLTAPDKETEVVDIALSIIEAVRGGIPLEEIKLFNVPKSYQTVVKHVFDLFNIPLSLNETNPLLSFPLTQAFLKRLENTQETHLKTAVSQILADLNQTVVDATSKHVLQSIQAVLNPVVYYVEHVEDNLPYIRYLFEQKQVRKPVIKPSVQAIQAEQFNPDAVSVLFVPGMHEGGNFTFIEENDLIDESVKQTIGHPTAKALNRDLIDLYTTTLQKAPHVIYSYALKDEGGRLEPSPVLTAMHLSTRAAHAIDGQAYSDIYDALNIKQDKDHFDIYGINTDKLKAYHHVFKPWFKPYDNRFTGLSRSVLETLLNHKQLSVTKTEMFFNCQFRFLLEHFLKITTIDNQRALNIGNVFHDVLEKDMDANYDAHRVQAVIDEMLDKDDTATHRDAFFLKRALKDIKQVLAIIKAQESLSLFQVAHRELPLSIPIKNGFILKGKIDKVMTKDNHVALIDYKTGQATLDVRLAYHGLKGQLLFYALLYGQTHENTSYAGLYEQLVLHPKFNKDDGVNREEALENKLKLIGYSTKEQDVLARFDPSFAQSEMIKGMRLKKDGSTFDARAKVMEKEDFEAFKIRLNNLLHHAVDEIEKGSFTINPKTQGNTNSCQYCPFNDVCYKTPQDTVKLSSFDKPEDVFNAVKKEMV